jgi:AAA family ATP:ADP antiporter
MISISRYIPVANNEKKVVAWSLLYIFSLFFSYYLLRPVRDSLGLSGGIATLPKLFTATMCVMLLLNPLFSALVKNLPRKKFIQYTYHFFAFNLLLFIMLFSMPGNHNARWLAIGFFIWVSVFNLFVVSVFWSTIVDSFTHEQGKRLFGLLAASATLGGIAGSSLTNVLLRYLSENWLLLSSAIFIEIAVIAASKVIQPQQQEHADMADKPVGGSFISGITHTFRSPYLLAIAGFMLLYTITSTFLYFQQAGIVSSHFVTTKERTIFFANLDLWVNIITLAFQLLLTEKMIKRFGVKFTLSILPLVSFIGFTALASAPILSVFVVVQVARRVTNFALARPTREILFTTLTREDRYKAKNFIDTVIYRFGDQAGSWSYSGLVALKLGSTEIAYIALPFCFIWFMLSIWLARKQQCMINNATSISDPTPLKDNME